MILWATLERVKLWDVMISDHGGSTEMARCPAPRSCTMLVLMAKISILVLADADDPQLKRLEDLRPIADVVIGDSVADFAVALLNARVVFHWSAPAGLLRELVKRCPKLEWVHSRSAGLEKTLFRELVESSIRVTNGSGVFSQSLGEFVLAAILY